MLGRLSTACSRPSILVAGFVGGFLAASPSAIWFLPCEWRAPCGHAPGGGAQRFRFCSLGNSKSVAAGLSSQAASPPGEGADVLAPPSFLSFSFDENPRGAAPRCSEPKRGPVFEVKHERLCAWRYSADTRKDLSAQGRGDVQVGHTGFPNLGIFNIALAVPPSEFDTHAVIPPLKVRQSTGLAVSRRNPAQNPSHLGQSEHAAGSTRDCFLGNSKSVDAGL